MVENYLNDDRINTFTIPYSEHSSYQQIIQFIQKLKPFEVVSNIDEDLDLSRLDEYLTTNIRRRFVCLDCKRLWYKTNNQEITIYSYLYEPILLKNKN